MIRRGRKVSLLITSLGLAILMSTPAHAIFGFGVHGGFDFTSFGDKQFGATQFADAAQAAGITGFDVNKWGGVTLTREAIDNPYLIGAHFYIDALPMLDIEASIDASFQKYKFSYLSPNPSLSELNKEAIYGRVGAYATVKRDIIDLPMFAFYLGGGLGLHFVAPVAGADLVVDVIGSDDPSATKPDIKDNISRETTMGYHALTGIRFKPPIIPLAFRIEGKYTSTGASGMERPDSVLSVYFCASIDI